MNLIYSGQELFSYTYDAKMYFKIAPFIGVIYILHS